MMNATQDVPVPSIRAPRFDLYGPIHKAIRTALGDLVIRMGKTTFANESAARRTVGELDELLTWCDEHIEHEIQFIHPRLAERLPNALAKIDDGHDDHTRLVTELRALIAGVRSASTTDLRMLAGKTLYLHFTTFVAETLAHMVEEERVLQPLMQRFFTDEELLAMNNALVQSLPPEKMFADAARMLVALNGTERAAMLAGARTTVPPPVLQALLAEVRPRLDEEEWSELLALCPFLG
jgi:iron-sulfur cluster repair protein YtfE (RIC family)